MKAMKPTALKMMPSTPMTKPAIVPPCYLQLLPETVAMMARMKPMTAAKMVDDRNAQTSEMMPRMIERAPLGFCWVTF